MNTLRMFNSYMGSFSKNIGNRNLLAFVEFFYLL